MANNKIKRYIWLIDIILQHGHLSRFEISDLWSRSSLNETNESYLPERTFFNHINSIREIFGIEISCDRSLGYYISDDGDTIGAEFRKWMFQSLSLNNIISNHYQLRERIILESSSSGQELLHSILEAMIENVQMKLTYKSYYREHPSTFYVAPYCLKFFKQRWYLIAKSEADDKPWIYSLDRIVNLELSKEKFVFPENFSSTEYFIDFYGVCFGDEYDSPENISIRVDESQVPYFRSLPIHSSQTEIRSADTYSIFQYHLIPTYDFTQEIISKLDTVEVLEPEWYRVQIKSIIQSMLKKY